MFLLCFFFKQKTAYEMRISDWSSDVCSSDLPTLRDRAWVEQQWEAARTKAVDARGAVLVLDEVQKVTGWSEVVKRLWDEDTHAEIGRASCRERVCQYV